MNEVTSSAVLTLDDKLLAMAISVNELRQAVKELWIHKAVDEYQLPETSVISAVDNHYKKRRLNRPLMEGEIRDAMNKFKTMIGVSQYLSVHPQTLKKYVKMYGLIWKPTRGTKVQHTGD